MASIATAVDAVAALPSRRRASLSTIVLSMLALSMLVCASLLGCASERSDGAAAQRAAYVCADGSRFVVTFPARSDHAILQIGGTAPRVLAQKRVGSGFLYEDSMFSLRGKGVDAIVSRPGGADTRCTAAP